MSAKQSYSREFFLQKHAGGRSSAQQIVPILLGLVPCRSVIDVGCGDGSWLRVFQEMGVEDILGIDGAYVTEDLLQISPAQFRACDLTQPLAIERQFDLAVSLEVAEHLPEESADGFVEALTRLAPVILFSAAIPFQGGVDHQNEQWPEYWARRFADKGFCAIDCLRPRIWGDNAVEWWYAQNILVFARENALKSYPGLQQHRERSGALPLNLIHPKVYLEVQKALIGATDPQKMSLKRVLNVLPTLFKRALADRFRR